LFPLLLSASSACLYAGPAGDDFADRIQLGAVAHLTSLASNASATKEEGEPDIAGNPGGKSVWWTWTAPQNGTLTVSTAGSDFDTLLGILAGDSVSNLFELASADDTLGPDPLTSLAFCHVQNGTVCQIVVDGYRGDFGDIASGSIVLSLDFVPDRYVVVASASETNRGSVTVDPAPDADGRYLVGTAVAITAQPRSGSYFQSWSGDIPGTNNAIAVTLTNDLSLVANFAPIVLRTVRRAPATVNSFNPLTDGVVYREFKVWSAEAGRVEYRITTDVPWLAVYPPSGIIEGETNTHSFDLIAAAALRPGRYLGTILIRPVAEGSEPQSVVVAVGIDPATHAVMWQTPEVGDFRVTGLRETSDGGFVTYGSSGSGLTVVRLDETGSNLWLQSYPGVAYTSPACLEQTADGGFIVGGNSDQNDFWMARLDQNGSNLWQRSFGGTNHDYLKFIKQTADRGFLLAGISDSPPSGNKTSEAFGSYDYWIVRLDPNGKRLWDRSFGGSGYENLSGCALSDSGEVLLSGYSTSGPDGNKTNINYGPWIVRLDQFGNKLGEVGLPNDYSSGNPLIVPITDGFLFATIGYGQFPPYVVRRFAVDGILKWQTNFPGLGTYPQWLDLAVDPDGSCLLYSHEYGGCCSSDNVYERTKLDAEGKIVWRRAIYGTRDGSSAFNTLLPVSDGGFVLGGERSQIVRLKAQPPLLPDRPVFCSLGYRFFISGETNRTYVTEHAPDIESWIPFRTNLLSEPELEIFDTTATNTGNRFYRSRPLP